MKGENEIDDDEMILDKKKKELLDSK